MRIEVQVPRLPIELWVGIIAAAAWVTSENPTHLYYAKIAALAAAFAFSVRLLFAFMASDWR